MKADINGSKSIDNPKGLIFLFAHWFHKSLSMTIVFITGSIYEGILSNSGHAFHIALQQYYELEFFLFFKK